MTDLTLQAIGLAVTAGQTCFLAWLGAKTAEQRQRIVELQAQVRDLQDRAHTV